MSVIRLCPVTLLCIMESPDTITVRAIIGQTVRQEEAEVQQSLPEQRDLIIST